MSKNGKPYLKQPRGLDFEPDPVCLRRFLAKVKLDAVTGCWLWQAHRDADGYGQFSHRGAAYWAHRWAYAAFRRPLIEGLTVDHKCKNPSCVNPWHLELETNSVNTANGNRDRNEPF